MKKKLGIIALATVFIVGILVLVLSQDKSTQTNDTITPQSSAPKVTNDSDASTQATATKSYITIDEYNQNSQTYANVEKVLFFHAPWCPICAGIDKEIVATPSKIPSGTIIIKTDYDKNTSLRQKYGVTYQYTFVQIDNDGKQLKKWSATSLDKAIAQVE